MFCGQKKTVSLHLHELVDVIKQNKNWFLNTYSFVLKVNCVNFQELKFPIFPLHNKEVRPSPEFIEKTIPTRTLRMIIFGNVSHLVDTCECLNDLFHADGK